MENYPSATLPQQAGTTERKWTDSILRVKLGEGNVQTLKTRELNEIGTI